MDTQFVSRLSQCVGTLLYILDTHNNEKTWEIREYSSKSNIMSNVCKKTKIDDLGDLERRTRRKSTCGQTSNDSISRPTF